MEQEVEKARAADGTIDTPWRVRARNWLINRARAYHLVFDSRNRHTDTVLADLARFCRANETTFHEDPRMHAVLEGRRDVWLRIQHHLKLNPTQLMAIYARKDEHQ